MPSDSEDKTMVENLGRLIKYNKNLLHLDFSYTGMDEPTIMSIGSNLRRAKSLLAIHFTGNPGVN